MVTRKTLIKRFLKEYEMYMTWAFIIGVWLIMLGTATLLGGCSSNGVYMGNIAVVSNNAEVVLIKDLPSCGDYFANEFITCIDTDTYPMMILNEWDDKDKQLNDAIMVERLKIIMDVYDE